MRIETLASLITGSGHELPPVPRVSRALEGAFRGGRRLAAAGFDTAQTQSPFDAASSGKRSSTWNPGADAIAAIVMAYGDTLVRKVRQLTRNNGWASNAVDSYVANSIGTGIVPTSMHPDPVIKNAIEQAWLRWTDESVADGVSDFYGQQRLAARMEFEGGEGFARLRPRRRQDGLSVPLQVQLLEAEQLPLTKNEDLPPLGGATRGHRIRSGIEFDLLGRRVAYHFFVEHPYAGASAQEGGNSLITQPVPSVLVDPAAGALHLFQPLRANQLRGLPRLTPVLTKLYELDQFDDATVSKQKNLSFFMLAVKRMAQEGVGVMNEASDAEGNAEIEMEPNTLQYLNGNEEIQEIGSDGVGATYDMFMRVQLHAIASGVGLTYEQLTGDLKGVTYSSIRQGVLEFRRRCEQWQHLVMVFQFCRPIWRAWMDAAVLSGALELPGYAENPAPYLAVEWTPPAWPWVDPETEVNAAVKECRAGFNTRSDVCKQKGTDRATVDRKQAEDNKSADGAKLKFDSDGRQPASGAAASNTPLPKPQPAQPPEESPQEVIQ